MTTIDIIRQIKSEKERQKRHPTYALFYEVLKVAETIYPMLAKEIITDEINELETKGVITTGPTINDIYIEIL